MNSRFSFLNNISMSNINRVGLNQNKIFDHNILYIRLRWKEVKYHDSHAIKGFKSF